jgi:hypothetical protein
MYEDFVDSEEDANKATLRVTEIDIRCRGQQRAPHSMAKNMRQRSSNTPNPRA